MTDAAFPVEVIAGLPVVTTPEAVDITNTDGLRSALEKASAPGHGTLVVDMGRTQFCDTAGLHALVAANKQVQAEGGRILLVMGGTAVLRIFAITGLDRVIPPFTSLEQALTQASAAPSPDDGSPAG
jgi:anti-sigma B factor antagonist